MNVGGIILCGGQSKRMGQPKAWLPFGGQTMLARVIGLLSEAVSPIVVVAAPEQQIPSIPNDVQIVRDEERGRGPLQGLLAGLTALKGSAEAAYVSSCDVPFLCPALIRRLIERLGDYAICVPRVGGQHHPLAAVYRVSVGEAAARLIAANRMRPFYLFETVPTCIVEAGELADVDPTLESLRNLNTPEEYEAALAEYTSRLP
jgi:molybdopterin-guanine dinucleotide biosynthesis protein A